MFITFINWILQLSENLGYTGILILMTIESSFLPFPSELAIPPAAWLASQGKMDIFLIILIGTLGSILGALINYYLAFYLGRPLVYRLVDTKLAKMLRLESANLLKAERIFLKNSRQATFVCRLIPVIRQLVSIPAGFTKMPLSPFILLTALGSFIWVSLLALLGYFLGSNQELLNEYYKEAQVLIGLAVLVWLLFFVNKKIRKYLKKKKSIN